MKTTKFTAFTVVLLFVTITAASALGQSPAPMASPLTVPPAPVRQPAEFDQMTGALIEYSGSSPPFGISYEVIAEMAENVTVCTIVASTSEKNTVLSLYTSHGIDTSHCTFLIAPTNSWWTRDYGPWFIFTGNNEQGIVDFTYNRPRPNDDVIPGAYAANQSIPYYFMSLTHSGGDYMTDGEGRAISTTLVWEENPGMTHAQINQTVHDYLGINTYYVVPDVNGDYIEHIDCWGKYLSPDTILIRSVPTSHQQYDEIEAAASYFKNQTSCYGTPYHVVRVYTPLNEPYTNSLILDNKVLVPIMGDQYDAAALQAYRDAMPGYEVLGFTGSWQSTDALHCRVMGITDRYMLYIHHIPLLNQTANPSGFPVTAYVHAYSGQSLTPGSPSLIYRVNGGAWSTLQMTSMGNENYTATIPSQPGGSVVSYYIHAEDESGRSANHPYIGADDAYTFTVIGQPNHAPLKPQTPEGNATGKPKQMYSFTTVTKDPDNDSLMYQWDWGDGTLSEWLGPYVSGTVASGTHEWAKKGSYDVRVKAKDTYGLESPWSDPLPVKMPLGLGYSWSLRGLLKERFPVLFWLLTHHAQW